MSAEDFIAQLQASGSPAQLRMMALVQYPQVAAVCAERERARSAWLARWDELSTRDGLLLAGRMDAEPGAGL